MHFSMGLLVALDTKSHQVFGRVITQSAPRLNVTDLKTLDRAARFRRLSSSTSQHLSVKVRGWRCL